MRKYHCIDYNLFGKRVHDRRSDLNLTQRELAELMDCNESYISKIETGRATPTLDFACLLSQHLKVGLDHLVLNTPIGQEIAEAEYENAKEGLSPNLVMFMNSVQQLAQKFEKDIEESKKSNSRG